MKTLAVCFVLLASSVSAQERTPDRSFQVGRVLAGSLAIADVSTSTYLSFHTHGYSEEKNPLVKPFAQNEAVYLVFSAGVIVGTQVVLTKLHPNHPKVARWLAWGIVAAEGVAVTLNSRMIQHRP